MASSLARPLLSFALALAAFGPARAEPSQPELLTEFIRPGQSTLFTTLHAAPGGQVLLEKPGPGGQAFLTTNGQVPIELGEEFFVTVGAAFCPDTAERFVPFAGALYYQIDRFDQGDLSTFLARTDGVTSEPVLFDGDLGGPFCIHDLVASGSGLYFVVEPEDESLGSELWRSDGTLQGSGPVATGFGPRQLSQLVDAGGTLFFVVGNPNAGPAALWKSDGTATVLVSDVFATEAIQDLTAAGTRVFFSGDAGSAGPELWVSDGTLAGTLPIELRSGSMGSFPDSFVALGAGVTFVADDGSTGREPWFSDGTVVGTSRLADIAPGSVGSDPETLARYGSAVVFAADDASHGREPWITDGTPAGTRLMADVQPGPLGSDPSGFTEASARVFFSADDGIHGAELHSSDGTSAGTRLELDIYVGPRAARPEELTESGGTLFFTAFEPLLGRELWIHEGGLTSLLWDTDARRDFITPAPPFTRGRLGERLFVSGFTPEGIKLHVTDGTPAGTFALDPLGAEGPLNADAFSRSAAVLDDQVFFYGATPELGAELFVTDGTLEGTRRLKDIAPGEESSEPREFAPGGSQVFFEADDKQKGAELWRSDGTEAGTQLVADIRTGPLGSRPGPVTWVGGQGFFLAIDSNLGEGLWRTDGTTEGTRRVRDGGSLTGTAALAGDFYFGVRESGLWRSDGTAAGTIKVLDLEPRRLVVFDGKLFFRADTPETGVELFVSDGTPAGTRPLLEIVPGPEDGYDLFAAGPSVVGDRIFFVAGAASQDRELWTSDGTAPGTRRVTAVPPEISGFLDARGRALFGSFSGNTSTLWHSDGTAGGTAPFATVENAVFHGVLGDRLILSHGPNVSGLLERDLYAVKLDTDDDGIFDEEDNCVRVVNPGQEDVDSSADDDASLVGLQSYGDACDADLDNDGTVGPSDFFGVFRPCLGADLSSEPACVRADLDGDGSVGPSDFFGRLRPALGKAPGPGLGD